jgi:hypothetical protein
VWDIIDGYFCPACDCGVYPGRSYWYGEIPNGCLFYYDTEELC